jgi:hypothetical protein
MNKCPWSILHMFKDKRNNESYKTDGRRVFQLQKLIGGGFSWVAIDNVSILYLYDECDMKY